MQHDYSLRGTCKEAVAKLLIERPDLIAVRGHYYCSAWGRQEHWWAIDSSGNIIDPTAAQFPSLGHGVYEPFNGFFECEYCGKEVAEEEVYSYGHHVYCSYKCFGYDVM